MADSIVGGSAASYTRSITVRATDSYVFRLIDYVADGSQPAQNVRATYFVDVVGSGGGGMAPLAGPQGVRLQDGSCGPRPPSGAARQAWLAWVFDHLGAEETCVIAVD